VCRKSDAEKPSGCKNAAKKSRKIKILNQGLYQRNKISALHHVKKKLMPWPYSGTYKNVRPGL